ncbi:MULTISPECIES: DUF2278 family protein [Calothrix]|uniref:DUF2278 family protein n=2 Tax=Calothrix TaxID=1186 RepID=A0ABR8ADA3_9CYAN|nr:MULTISPECIES: DUF2278 family protein [Calothrix]MBD2196507.1 DUF2278 family protein [Calothrix parietina FACHB-288]MBD2224598.1 DUF2278 family protein [Calothrix anomala FACHB-343]
MPLKNYGVLKCKAVERKLGEGPTPHYQVLVTDDKNIQYRIAINVKSKQSPSELLYFVDENFSHPITKELQELDFGFNELPRKPGGAALDYIRGNLFDPTQMKPLPYNVPGPDNDLNELLELYIARAIASPEAVLYPFGERWGPEVGVKDKYFGFLPGNGIHDIHFNQGSVGQFQKDNGVWQDGGLLIHYPARNQWVGIFLAFQSQSFHTDDTTGNRIDDVSPIPVTGAVRIVAALVNPSGDDVGKETVTLINTSPDQVDLSGWAIADRLKRKQRLSGTINPGEALKVPLGKDGIQLDNNGGIITLLDNQGIKVDGVSYTKEDSRKQGWTIVF